MQRTILMGVVIVLLLGVSIWLVFNKNGSTPAPGGQETQRGQSGQSGAPGAGRERFMQFREEHRSTFQLTGLVGNIARLEQEGMQPLTAAQAKAMLGILTPLRTQDKLSQDGAKETVRALQKVLTQEQRDEIAKMPEQRGGGRGGPVVDRPRGERPAFDSPAMKNFNPFNPSTGGPMGGRWEAFFKQLEAKAG